MTWGVWCRRLGLEPVEVPEDPEPTTLREAVLLVDMHRAWRSGIDPLVYRASLASELLAQLSDDE